MKWCVRPRLLEVRLEDPPSPRLRRGTQGAPPLRTEQRARSHAEILGAQASSPAFFFCMTGCGRGRPRSQVARLLRRRAVVRVWTTTFAIFRVFSGLRSRSQVRVIQFFVASAAGESYCSAQVSVGMEDSAQASGSGQTPDLRRNRPCQLIYPILALLKPIPA